MGRVTPQPGGESAEPGGEPVAGRAGGSGVEASLLGPRLPLSGWRVLVTRATDQADSLAESIRQMGGEPVEAPLISIRYAADWGELDAWLTERSPAWWVFTSANSVRAVAQRMEALEQDGRSWAQRRVAVVGSATQAELWARLRLRADLVPQPFTGARLWQQLAEVTKPGDRVIWPRGDRADPSVVHPVRRRGVQVVSPVVYETRLRSDMAAALAPALQAGVVDALTFASPSAVEAFVQGLGAALLSDVLDPAEPAVPRGKRPLVVCIGPRTEERARRLGLPVDRVAAESTAAGLVKALVE